MFKAGELEAVSMALEPQFRELEQRIMSDVVRRIKINGEVTRAADWQITRLAQLGESKREIKKVIKDTLGLSTKEINHLYKDITRKGYERDSDLYKYKGRTQIPFAENHELQQLIGAVSNQTNSELKNITQSLGFAKRGADGKLTFTPVADYYQKTLDSAMLDISSGAFDYNTVLKRTVKEMTNSGLRTVDYATGWSNRVDVAARRAVMTGMSQLTAKVNDSNAEQLGTDTFEVTAHGGARPEHQEWQGKWYTKDELESICGLGEVTGLCGANCYHDYYPVVPGISKPTYTPEEIEEFNRKENEPVEYNGKKYTKYEATQRQRKLETTMRAQRQEIKLLKEGGASEDDLIAARCRYRGTSAEYARFSKAMDLPQQRERVTVDGLGNIGQGKYTQTDNVNNKSVDNGGESGIIEVKKNPIEEKVELLSEKEYRYGTMDDFSRMSKEHNKNISKEDVAQIKGHTKEDGSPGGYVATHNYSNINSNMRNDGYAGNKLDDDDYKTIDALRNAISTNMLDGDYTLVRYVNADYLTSVFGIEGKYGGILSNSSITNAPQKEVNRIIEKIKDKSGIIVNEKSFISASVVQDKNIMTDKAVRIELKAPKGTNAYVTKNRKESECILGGSQEGLNLYINKMYYSEIVRKVVIEAYVL